MNSSLREMVGKIEVHTYLLLQEAMEAQKGEELEVIGHAATVCFLKTTKTAMLDVQSDLSFSALVSILLNIHFIRNTQ